MTIKVSKGSSLTDPLNFDGIEIEIGRKTYTMPPLPITKLIRLKYYQKSTDFSEALENGDFEKFENMYIQMLDFIYEALLMNYPDVTREETVDLINTSQFNRILPYVGSDAKAIDEIKNELRLTAN
jgi:hypothetical protein